MRLAMMRMILELGVCRGNGRDEEGEMGSRGRRGRLRGVRRRIVVGGVEVDE